MYRVDPTRAVLLVVDAQRAFGEVIAVPNVEKALGNMRAVTEEWRGHGGRVILTQHRYKAEREVGRLADFLPDIYGALREGSPFTELYPGIQREEDCVIRKTRFGALERTGLVQHLEEGKFDTVIVVGLTTPICVQTTVDGLMMADYKVVVVEDCCAAQAMGAVSGEEAHTMAIERMRCLFAEVVLTSEVCRRFSVMSGSVREADAS